MDFNACDITSQKSFFQTRIDQTTRVWNDQKFRTARKIGRSTFLNIGIQIGDLLEWKAKAKPNKASKDHGDLLRTVLKQSIQHFFNETLKQRQYRNQKIQTPFMAGTTEFKRGLIE